MARVEHTELFVTDSAESACFNAAERALLRLGASLKSRSPEIVAKLGSGARTRLLGGMFVSESTLPVAVRVNLRPEGEGSIRVSITAEEAMGFGSLAGMNDKFRSRCATVAVRLRQDLEEELGRVGPDHDRQPSKGTDSVFTQIEKLAGLRDAGILTDEEFEQKKTELLSRL